MLESHAALSHKTPRTLNPFDSFVLLSLLSSPESVLRFSAAPFCVPSPFELVILMSPAEPSSKVFFQTKSVATKFVENGIYILYFKGLVSGQIAANGKMTAMAGFEVTICDQRDQLLFKLKELVRDAEIDRKEVEIRALVHGLSVSLKMEIRKVVIYCKDSEIYQM
ncbi:hypothetical protein EUTSA_v10002779mg, partial [Eutrema salsugineum]